MSKTTFSKYFLVFDLSNQHPQLQSEHTYTCVSYEYHKIYFILTSYSLDYIGKILITQHIMSNQNKNYFISLIVLIYISIIR